MFTSVSPSKQLPVLLYAYLCSQLYESIIYKIAKSPYS